MRARTPLLVDLQGRAALVVGGGPTAHLKARTLADGGARVMIVSPEIHPDLARFADERAITTIIRNFATSDLEGCWIAITCTGIRQVDDRVAAECERRRIWCINATRADRASAAMPATAHGPRGESVAVSGAGDPQLARAIRDSVTQLWRLRLLPLDRRPVTRRSPGGRSGGRVILVGAGPGDPELITVRGLRALAEADVLVVDRLAPCALWDSARERVEVLHVGKTAGTHPVPQHEINKLLVDRARAGNTVVRLKGGDPFVMGRGAEEVLACLAEGIPVEVVPGVSSALAVPAGVGIPVTTRGIASSFLVATAHDGPEPLEELVRNAPPETTIVLMMGTRHLPRVIDSLLESGRPTDTPMAVVESGWTPEERCWTGTLEGAREENLVPRPPAVVIIGRVVELRDRLGSLGHASALAGHGRRHAGTDRGQSG